MVEQTDGKQVSGAPRGAVSYRVVASDHHAQATYVTLLPGEDTGVAVHDDADEIVVFLDGEGTVVVDGEPRRVACGGEMLLPAGMTHVIRNTGPRPLHLYALRDPST